MGADAVMGTGRPHGEGPAHFLRERGSSTRPPPPRRPLRGVCPATRVASARVGTVGVAGGPGVRRHPPEALSAVPGGSMPASVRSQTQQERRGGSAR